MAIEGFDYKSFAASMAEQAKELVPADLDDFQKEYVVNTLGKFTLLAGEALYNDTELKLDEGQAVFITQIIAEWSFHKTIDLVHSGILPQYWDDIMQKIAYTIFEIAKQAVIRKIPQDQLLKAVEHHVVKVYNQSIEELEQKGVIDAEVKSRAESQSNIDSMAQQAQAEQQRLQEEKVAESVRNAEEAQRKREERRAQKRAGKQGGSPISQGITQKQLKLMSLAMVLKVLSQDKVTTILNKFDHNDSTAISQYMGMVDLESHIDGDLVTDCIKDMKKFLPVKKKLTKENVISDFTTFYATSSRDKIERAIKNERPLVKRFVAQAYDGEYGDLPLRVAGVLAQYVGESI